ncbi:MAG TPA: PmoA family protein [Pirellulales bacterium]|jgi:hypothetical protein
MFAVAAFAMSAAMFSADAASAGEIAVEKHDGGAKVTIDGKLFADYLIKTGPKPIVWPIIGPTGKEMTRAFPMRFTVGEKPDHPHHRSLWFTHGNVNGIDFWSEPSLAKQVHREYLKCEADGKQAVIGAVNDWIDPKGKKQCEDVRTLTFRDGGDARSIDFDITIKASDGPVKFGDTKEGSMGVRVPTALDLTQLDKKKTGGNIVNANGIRDKETWGKAAPWVDYHGKLDDEMVGIAMLNHPSSFRYPTYWHVRDYGLFAANPFGLHDFTQANEHEGDYTLPAGETVTFRYRVLFHKGDEQQAKLAEAFEAYSREQPADAEAKK